jgi:hypothetical protein
MAAIRIHAADHLLAFDPAMGIRRALEAGAF